MQSTLKDVQAIIRGARAVDQMRKDIKLFLFLLWDEFRGVKEFPFSIVLGKAKGNDDWLSLNFEEDASGKKIIWLRSSLGGCEPEVYDIMRETPPIEVTVDLYKKLPLVLAKLHELGGEGYEESWGLNRYREAATLLPS